MGGGVNTNKSEQWFTGGLEDLSVTILANNHNAAVIVEYEENSDSQLEGR